jgi:hypothetical protein
MLMSTCSRVDTPACHSSPLAPDTHVPRSERHTVHHQRNTELVRPVIHTFSVLVQVRVEAMITTRGMSERYQRRPLWILAWAENIELEQTVFVWCPFWPDNESPFQVSSSSGNTGTYDTYFIKSGRDIACFT